MKYEDFEEDLKKTHDILTECLDKNNVPIPMAAAALSLCFCALIRNLGAEEEDVKEIARQMARLSASLIKRKVK